ncbi:rhomboid protein [Pelomyxa schiedti]|nr:rhomboid protein [Pelomyxa schiedti]
MPLFREDALIYGVMRYPCAAGACALCLGIFLYQLAKSVPVHSVALSYESVVEKFEFWRVVSGSLSHAGVLHVAFNVSSLWALAAVEPILGHLTYLRVSFFLLFSSISLTMLCYHVMIFRYGWEHYRTGLAVGYSCVVFGIMTIAHQMHPAGALMLFGLRIPFSLLPLGSLILTTILIPQASFIGHTSGLILGYMYSFGFFRWFDTGTFFLSLSWCTIAGLWTLKKSHPNLIPNRILQQPTTTNV